MAKVLIAEDEDASREVMTQVLARAGHEAKAARNAGEAIAAARDFSPDVLVVDWLLPDATGLEVASQVKAAHPSVAVIFISGFSTEELKAESCHLHPAAILPKPFSTQHIREAVESAVAGRQHAKA
jgi:two-component system, OmpR family, response regulator